MKKLSMAIHLFEMIIRQGLTIHKLQGQLEDASQRIEELEQQNAFECGCVESRDEQIKDANECIKSAQLSLKGYMKKINEYKTKWGVE